jgi:coenzyme F420-reducing hydrogenase delta subunit
MVTWVSNAEENKFAKVVKEVTKDIRKLVPTQHFKRENIY